MHGIPCRLYAQWRVLRTGVYWELPSLGSYLADELP
jgi:hypothetical protein